MLQKAPIRIGPDPWGVQLVWSPTNLCFWARTVLASIKMSLGGGRAGVVARHYEKLQSEDRVNTVTAATIMVVDGGFEGLGGWGAVSCASEMWASL